MNAIKKLGDSVPTQVRYLSNEWRDSSARPRIFDRNSRRSITDKIDVFVQNARNLADVKQLDTNGFELRSFVSPITNFSDPALVSGQYHPTIAGFC